MHTKLKTAAMGHFESTRFTGSPRSQCHFEGTSSQRVVFQIPTTVVNMSANTNDRLANTAVLSCTKTWVRSGQYFIFMVASAAASCFALFHAARNLELLRMMLPRTRVGNFSVKKFSLPDSFYEIFLTRKFIT